MFSGRIQSAEDGFRLLSTVLMFDFRHLEMWTLKDSQNTDPCISNITSPPKPSNVIGLGTNSSLSREPMCCQAWRHPSNNGSPIVHALT